MATTRPDSGASSGPVLFAYDGSELAGMAIKEGGRQLVTGRDALILCVWQPVDVGFEPVGKRHFDSDQATEVKSAAEETAAYGASLAEAAGFRAQGIVVEAAPIWQGIVKTAEENNAGLIVLGSHRRGGLVGHLLGNVAAAVVAHATLPVLIVHQRSQVSPSD